MMWKNEHKPGNMAVLVNAPHPGLKSFEDVIEASRRSTHSAALAAAVPRASPSRQRRITALSSPP